jgi:hypothetical protein
LPPARVLRLDDDRPARWPTGTYRGLERIALRCEKAAPLPTAYAGPFRIRVLPAAAHPDWPSHLPRPLCFLEIRNDPKTPLLALDDVTFAKCLDEEGQVVKVSATGRLAETAQPMHQARVGLPLASCIIVPVAAPRGNWRTLEGRLAVRIEGLHQLAEVRALDQEIGSTRNGPLGFSLKVVHAEALDDGEVQLRLRLSNLEIFEDAIGPPQVVRVRPGFVALRGPADVGADCVRLFDRHGRPLVRRSLTSRLLPGPDSGVELDLIFDGPVYSLRGLRLAVSSPRLLFADVPFVLHNLK